jgi:hypothetical protein
MSATMAGKGGQVQLEQSDMCLVLNMARIAKGDFSRDAIEETKYLIKKPRAKVHEEQKRGVECLGHNKVTAAIQRHPAILRHNQMSGCPSCQDGTAKNPQTCCRRKGTGACPPD